MKTCPSCNIRYPDALEFCPKDGAQLPPGARANTQSIYDRLLGTTIDGRYAIESKLGEGGMGVVYAARHAIIDKRVAIKVLKKEAQHEETAAQRFIQEARSASKIGHANIVDITDFGVIPDGSAYFVMEFLEGTTLGHVIAEGPVPARRAIKIAAQMARGLQAAHKHGIIHRDLKPDNIFLIERDGQTDVVKIVDFGIAKVQTGGPAQRLTQAGMVLGTPEYMSPEQATGKETDHRVDEYALGCILYEMLTSEVPFKGTNSAATLTKHVFEAVVPPRKRRPDIAIPPALEAVVLKAMAKKPDERYASMLQVLEALDGAAAEVEGTPAGVRGASRSSQRETAPPERDARTQLVRATDAESDLVPARSKGGVAKLVAVGGVVVALGVGGLIVFGRGGGGAAGSQPERMPVSVEKAAPAPPEARPAPAPVAPAEAVFTLRSAPSGATVYLDGTRIGSTPLPYKHARGTQPMEFVFKLAGYRDVSRTLVADGDHDIEVALVGKHEHATRSAGKGSSAAASPSPKRSSAAPAQNLSDLRDPFR